MSWAEAFWHLVGVLVKLASDGTGRSLADLGSAGLLAGSAAAVLLVALLVTRATVGGAGAPIVRPFATRRVLRDRDRRVGVPRHRDPDASGRSRPRAPTAALAAA
ncbi:DUF6412 domain-containing protein [Luedemannella flava]|uniref:DUF6412 domain-containing protein n=1 Tax=Luedemannella flava TaxID=349316 RepID=UPI0031DF2B05